MASVGPKPERAFGVLLALLHAVETFGEVLSLLSSHLKHSEKR